MISRLSSLVLLFTLLVTTALGQAPQSQEHVVMGMPSAAGKAPDNFLLDKGFFVVSYNNSKGTPNWVAWRLAKEYLGDAPRKPFHPDPDLPSALKKVLPADYKNSGFDRGHLCPHSDRDKTDEMSKATFVMTNMMPQSPENNQKAWTCVSTELVRPRRQSTSLGKPARETGPP